MAGVIDSARTKPLSIVAPKPLDQGDFAKPLLNPAARTSATTPDGSVNPVARTGPPDMSGVAPGTPSDNPIARTPGGPAGTATTLPAGTVAESAADTALGSAGGGQATRTSASPLAWNPTSGIVDQIRGITPQNVEAVGMISGGIADTQGATATGYDATGYDAKQGTAVTSDANLSGALDNVLSKDSPIVERARAGAAQTANQRGLLNSSMAAQGGEAAAIDAALPIAQGDVQNAQFNAEQQNVMTINNVQQANAALAFHAQAQNEASQFAAAAKNSVSQFNSQEAQQKAIASAQLWDQAAQFSAAAENAARTQNAQAYNDAMQRYVDAKNAAIAAQNDAENLARRDTAQIQAQKDVANIGAQAQIAAAGIHGAATVQAAKIGADASKEMNQANLSERQQEFQTSQGNQQFNTFQNGLTAIQLSDMEPDAKQNALHNYMSVWSANGDLPFTIDMTQFPPSTNPPPPGP